MIIRVFVCNSCDGDLKHRTFEVEYANLKSAEESEKPACPVCNSSESVVRFYGYNIFKSVKNSEGRSADDPLRRFLPVNESPVQGIVSIGIRLDGTESSEMEEAVRQIVEKGVVESEASSGGDFLEENFNLRNGTPERALFEAKQQKMIDELKSGQRVSGFFMPISDSSVN